MKDFAIHSPNDGELLIRLHDELVRNGFVSRYDWNKENNPELENELAYNEGRLVFYYTLSIYTDKLILYFNHDCSIQNIHHNLTPENFKTVLNEILNEFNIERRHP